MNETKLKPCPFCGQMPKLRHYAVCYDVACVNESCERQPRTYAWNYPETAIDEWNKLAEKQEPQNGH